MKQESRLSDLCLEFLVPGLSRATECGLGAQILPSHVCSIKNFPTLGCYDVNTSMVCKQLCQN